MISLETHEEKALRQLIYTDPTIGPLLLFKQDGEDRYRIHPLELPDNSPLPAMVYTCIDDESELTNDGPQPLTRARYQIDIFTKRHDYATLETLRKALKKRLHGFRGAVAGVHFSQIAYLGRNPASEPETASDRCSVDFEVWFDEP